VGASERVGWWRVVRVVLAARRTARPARGARLGGWRLSGVCNAAGGTAAGAAGGPAAGAASGTRWGLCGLRPRGACARLPG